MFNWKLDRKSAYVPDVIPNSDPAMYRKAGFGHPIGSGRNDPLVPSQPDLAHYSRRDLPSFCAPDSSGLLITNCPDPRTQGTQTI